MHARTHARTHRDIDSTDMADAAAEEGGNEFEWREEKGEGLELPEAAAAAAAVDEERSVVSSLTH